MKKTISLLLILTNVILMTACSSSQNNSKVQKENNLTENVSKIQSNIDSFFKDISKKEYDNLNISNAKVKFPNISEYHNLRLYSESNVAINERIDNVKKIVNKYFPEHVYSEDNLFWWGNIPGASSDETYADGWGMWPKVSENKDTIVSMNYNGSFLYESDAAGRNKNDAYFLLNPNTFAGTMIRGVGKSITNSDYEHLAGWFPTYTYEKIERYNIDSLPDISYKLYDKETSLSDAVNYAVGFFNNDYLSSFPDSPIKPQISAVDVCKYDNIYGYRFLLQNNFEGIAFDYTYDLGMVSKMSDDKIYSDFTNEAFMAKSNDIDFWYMTQPYTKVEYDGNVITDIIPPDEALSIMSDELTKNVIFDVITIDFVYCPLAFEDESSETTAEAAWKIESFNPNDEKTYIVYVNATNGELRYYTASNG